jgi:hypothetical protein
VAGEADDSPRAVADRDLGAQLDEREHSGGDV